MLVYIIMGAAILAILLIAVICILIWKKNKKKKKHLDKLPKITNQQSVRYSDTITPAQSEKAFDGRTDLGTARSGVGMVTEMPDNDGLFDETVGIDPRSGENAFLIDRLHGNQLIITKPSIIVGTDIRKADFIIEDSKVVSRQHAVLYKKDGCYFVTDNHSTNHTYVNEIILKPGEVRELHTGDIIRVADVSLEFLIR